MVRYFEPDELRLAADLAEWLTAYESKFTYDIVATFHFDRETTGVVVQRDGIGEYSVSVE